MSRKVRITRTITFRHEVEAAYHPGLFDEEIVAFEENEDRLDDILEWGDVTGHSVDVEFIEELE
ncbi:MAG: hypothetical protein ACRCYU_12320 [Nocardioides sp.]